MKAIGYIRVSTVEQSNEGVSLENQTEKIKQYCKLNDLELTWIIKDAGKSGKNCNRPGLKSLLQRLDKIDCVVVYKLDRLSRKVKDTLELIEQFEQAGVTFHSINEKIDTKSAMGRFFLNIVASLAQMERDLISERTIDALKHKKANNKRFGQVPYGWKLKADGETLERNLNEQKAIKLIEALKGKGLSLRQICHELTTQGFTPHGKKWHPQTIKNILEKAA